MAKQCLSGRKRQFIVLNGKRVVHDSYVRWRCKKEQGHEGSHEDSMGRKWTDSPND